MSGRGPPRHVIQVELAARGLTPTNRLYDPRKLDGNGDWLDRRPDELYFTGAQFDNARSDGRSVTLPTNNGHQKQTDGASYPEPDTVLVTPQNPYYLLSERYPPPAATHDVPPRHESAVAACPRTELRVDFGRQQQKQTMAILNEMQTSANTLPPDGDWHVVESKAARRLRKRSASPQQNQRRRSRPRPLDPETAAMHSTEQHVSVPRWLQPRDRGGHSQSSAVETKALRQPQPPTQPLPSGSTTLVDAQADDPFACRWKGRGCKSVTKRFESESERNKHENIHLNFRCAACRRKFSGQEALDQHRADRHPNGPKPSVRCLYCPKMYTREDNLRRHVKSDHPDEFIAMGGAKEWNLSTVSSQTAVPPTAPQTPIMLLPKQGLLSPPATEKAVRKPYDQAFPPLMVSPTRRLIQY